MSGGPSQTGHAYEDRYVTLADGLRLHYRDYAGATDRPPLLCLHGLTRNARDFTDFAARYSPRWRVIAVDFRGRGSSDYDPVPARYTPLTYAGDVVQLLDAISVDRAVFVGTSLGGLVTMIVAAAAPQRIAASVLNDVGPDVSAPGIDRILAYVGNDRRFRDWDEAADAIASNHASAFELYGHEDFVRMAKRVCREEDGEIRFDYDMAIAEPFRAKGPVPKVDMWPLFNAVGQKPLLVVRGERSDLLTAASLEKMHEAVPTMKSVVVPAVGHAPMLDEPSAAAAIDSFLESLDA